jgi:hypothetical protein
VWSVGLLLHWVVAGGSGYDGMPRRDGLAALRRVIAGRPRLAEGLPGPVAEIVRACLAPPADRPAAAVVADRVAAVAADMAAAAPAPTTPPAAPAVSTPEAGNGVPAMAPAPG